MILVLEDEEWRRAFFMEKMGVPEQNITKYPDDLCLHAEMITDAGGAIEAIYLDHDLGVRVQDPYPRDVTGVDAARRLATLGIPCRYVVHSMNPVGAEHICATLRDAGLNVQRIPFGDLLQQHGWNVPLLDAYCGGGADPGETA